MKKKKYSDSVQNVTTVFGKPGYIGNFVSVLGVLENALYTSIQFSDQIP